MINLIEYVQLPDLYSMLSIYSYHVILNGIQNLSKRNKNKTKQ